MSTKQSQAAMVEKKGPSWIGHGTKTTKTLSSHFTCSARLSQSRVSAGEGKRHSSTELKVRYCGHWQVKEWRLMYLSKAFNRLDQALICYLQLSVTITRKGWVLLFVCGCAGSSSICGCHHQDNMVWGFIIYIKMSNLLFYSRNKWWAFYFLKPPFGTETTN